MEIRNAEEIVRYGHSVRPNMLRPEYFKTKWISVDSLLNEINKARDKGNLEGEKGFSSALFLSKLIKELENATTLNSSSAKSESFNK